MESDLSATLAALLLPASPGVWMRALGALLPALALILAAPHLRARFPGCSRPSLTWAAADLAAFCLLGVGVDLAGGLGAWDPGPEPAWVTGLRAGLAGGLVLAAGASVAAALAFLRRAHCLRRARACARTGRGADAVRAYCALGLPRDPRGAAEMATELHARLLDPTGLAPRDLLERADALPAAFTGGWFSVTRFHALLAAAEGLEDEGNLVQAVAVLARVAQELPRVEDFARDIGVLAVEETGTASDAGAATAQRRAARREPEEVVALFSWLGDLPAMRSEVLSAVERLRPLTEGGGLLLQARRRIAAGDLHGAAELLDGAGGDPVAAAACYAKAGDLVRAGGCYEKAGRRGEALIAYRLAGERSGQARQLEATGQLVEAAVLYESIREPKHAADLYVAAGMPDRAVRVLEDAGETEGAADLAVRRGLPVEAARLCHRIGEDERALPLLVGALKELRKRSLHSQTDAGREWRILALLEETLWSHLGNRRTQAAAGTAAATGPDAPPGPAGPAWDGLAGEGDLWA